VKVIDQNQLRMREIERLLRKSFQEALRRSSRYPSSFGGLEGYRQLAGIVQAMQEQLVVPSQSYLHLLLVQGEQALNHAAELASSLSDASFATCTTNKPLL
jgi:hypothetical protein